MDEVPVRPEPLISSADKILFLTEVRAILPDGESIERIDHFMGGLLFVPKDPEVEQSWINSEGQAFANRHDGQLDPIFIVGPSNDMQELLDAGLGARVIEIYRRVFGSYPPPSPEPTPI